MRRLLIATLASLAVLLLAILPASAQRAQDRYVGYYYPSPNQIEVYCARVPRLQEASKKRRVGFIIGIKTGMTKKPYESPYTVFAKGGQSTKLIIISKMEGYLNTVYRARALLADLSTSARTTPIFANSKAPEELTFLDLISLLGFESVTLSDGDSFAHQIRLLSISSPNCKPKTNS